MNNYVGLTIQLSPERQELIMAFLYEMGFEAFVESETQLQAFIPINLWGEDIKSQVFGKLHASGYAFSEKIFENRDWNAEWEANFQDIVISNELRIRAIFHPYDKRFKEEIIIAPKMAFGTGHHATTSMLLEWMIGQDLMGKKVLDFGCGTGILGIYAIKKKADFVAFVDIEEPACENTHENLRLNQLESQWVKQGSIDSIPKVTFDLILANITRNVIVEHLDELLIHLNHNGSLIISGFLEADKNFMLEYCESKKLKLTQLMQKQDWIAMAWVKP
ncbi:MAG: 50S ribosomal protein L11 methyltransferase [Saprospiraceae bacterium]|nr:50S ribosomal protein L11 methyltransferase [Saprospiraceae bacterium]